MSTLRLFIALPTPEPVKAQIVEIQSRLKQSGGDVRWEPVGKLHATLKFLGATDAGGLPRKALGVLPEIVSYLEGVARAQSPLKVRYMGVGCFPNRRSPRVIWVGMEDAGGNLAALHEAVETALVPLGFKPEERKFHPHVTLGRVKKEGNTRGLLRVMESITFESQPVVIHNLMLMKSDLKPDGSVYTTLNTFALTAPEPGGTKL
jgi:2'-5' RNA ligase